MPSASNTFTEAITWLSDGLKDYKVVLEHAVGIHNDALHVIVGVLLQITIALMLRKNLAHWIPLVGVVVLELANEVNDILSQPWPEVAMQMGESAKDLALTIVLPVLLLLFARYRPTIFARLGSRCDHAMLPDHTLPTSGKAD